MADTAYRYTKEFVRYDFTQVPPDEEHMVITLDWPEQMSNDNLGAMGDQFWVKLREAVPVAIRGHFSSWLAREIRRVPMA